MQITLFGRKLGMTQIFNAAGRLVPVTIIKTEVCKVSQIKTEDTDGYNAIQIAYGKTPIDKLTQPLRGHLKKVGEVGLKAFGEFRVVDPSIYELGQVINLESITNGQCVKVSGKSIGKGFMGNQKRHNFRRGPMSHGSKNHRLPGSIGAGSTPGRVYPGKKMAGHLGNQTTTIKNSEVLYVNSQENILVLKGSLPGKKNSILKIEAKNY